MIKFTQITILFMVGALLQGFGSILGSVQQSSNYENALQAQKEENEKNRAYNFMLAQKQNEWNIQQWERANEYNTPLNQMLRLKAAGLNPNLVYGNGAGQSIAAPNPQLTSGAPSTPQDMSLFAQRPTIGQVLTQSLNNRLLEAQIKSVESSARKNNAEAGLSEIEERALSAIEQINGMSLDSSVIPSDWKTNPIIASRLAEFEKAVSDAKASNHFANIQGHKEFEAEIDREFKRQKVQLEIDELSQALNIRKDEAEFIAKTLAARIKGVTFETKSKEYEAILNSPELIKKLPEGIKPLVSLLNLIFRGS